MVRSLNCCVTQGQALGPKPTDPQDKQSRDLNPSFSVLKPVSPTASFNDRSKLLPTANSLPCLVKLTGLGQGCPAPLGGPRAEELAEAAPPVGRCPHQAWARTAAGGAFATPVFQSTPCHLLAVWFGIHDVTSLRLTFFIYQMGIVIIIIIANCLLSLKCWHWACIFHLLSYLDFSHSPVQWTSPLARSE